MFNSYTVNTLRYDPARCINCGLCLVVCPHAVFASNGRVVQLAHPKACMECGACQLNCPTNAIAVESGVGCAAAMIYAALSGKSEVTCGPDIGPVAQSVDRAESCGGQTAEAASRDAPT